MRRIAVRGIIFKEDKLLCVKLKNYGEAIAGDYWCLPGGSVEPRENLHSAMKRELIEETGITPEIGKLLYLNHFTLDGKEHLEFFFHIKNTDDYLDIDVTKASLAEEEIAQIAFINPKNHYVMPSFLKEVDVSNQIHAQQPVEYFFTL